MTYVCEALETELADFAEHGLVYNFDSTSVDNDYFFGDKGRKCADGIRGRHVGEAGEILARHIDFQRSIVVLIAVVVAEHYQSFSQTSADVFLCECYYACVCAAKIARKFLDEEQGNVVVFLNELIYKCKRQ